MERGVAAILFLIISIANVVPAVRKHKCVCGMGKEATIGMRIIRGSVAYPHEFPFMVYMKYQGRPYCGGAIINDRYILTAGHCVYSLNSHDIKVVVGAYNIETKDGDAYPISSYKIIENYHRYDAYDDNDVALIKLKKRLVFNDRVTPVCLTTGGNYDGRTAVIAGWGTTQHGNMSDFLLKSNVKILSDKVCTHADKIGRKFKQGENICAYGFQTDTCQGDSGSPLIYEIAPYKYEAIGIVSWGEGCAPPGIPGVYANLGHYMPWILDNTRDGKYCQEF